jgi:hypothetical protein
MESIICSIKTREGLNRGDGLKNEEIISCEIK